MSCALCDVRQVPKADMVQHDCDVRFVPLGDPLDIAVSMSAVQLHKIKKPACSGGLLFYEFGG
jgi:hypothetical protein